MEKIRQQSGSNAPALESAEAETYSVALGNESPLGVFRDTILNETSSVPTLAPSPGGFRAYPVGAAASIAVASVLFLLLLLYLLCRCLARKKKRDRQLANLTPRATDPRMAGVRADQAIQFVVPTTALVVVSETTEDSVSETDCSSGGIARALALADDGRRRRRSDFQIDPADLQRGLYVGVTPLSSSCPGDLGEVGFSLRYDVQQSRLTVQVIGARNLPGRRRPDGTSASTNPCAKLALLPDRTTRHTTCVLKNTSCPRFDESFAFCVRRDELLDRKLKISVWDYDRRARKSLIGRVTYGLGDSGLTDALATAAKTEIASGEIWTDLGLESQPHHHRGQEEDNIEALLSLCYDPDTSTLTLTVLKFRGIDVQRDRSDRQASVYSEVTLRVGGKRVMSRKTPSRKKAPEVSFDSPFSVRLPGAALRKAEMTVALCERLWPRPLVGRAGGGRKSALGRTRTGADCGDEQGLQHWRDMVASPKSTCAQWHVLGGW